MINLLSVYVNWNPSYSLSVLIFIPTLQFSFYFFPFSSQTIIPPSNNVKTHARSVIDLFPFSFLFFPWLDIKKCSTLHNSLCCFFDMMTWLWCRFLVSSILASSVDDDGMWMPYSQQGKKKPLVFFLSLYTNLFCLAKEEKMLTGVEK